MDKAKKTDNINFKRLLEEVTGASDKKEADRAFNKMYPLLCSRVDIALGLYNVTDHYERDEVRQICIIKIWTKIQKPAIVKSILSARNPLNYITTMAKYATDDYFYLQGLRRKNEERYKNFIRGGGSPGRKNLYVFNEAPGSEHLLVNVIEKNEE